METSGKHPERIAENIWFVFFAYFLAIAAWYAVSGNVFVSPRWSTIAETRKRGQRNLLVLSLAMFYLVVYVYFQAKSGDYKEVCLTFAAFVVAILHILRTALGIWQLHVFKHWVIRSIRSMESLGYRTQLSGFENRRNVHRERSSAAALEPGRDRAHLDADNIFVNNAIVGNRLSEGYVQCYLRFFTPKQKHVISSAGCFLMRALLTLFYAVKSTVRLGGIIWPLLHSRSPLYSKPDCTPFLRPREPEELWLRWATVLVSCAFPNWLSDMRKSRPVESISQESETQVYRDRFAQDVLRSAVLHCERDTPTTSSCSLLPFHLWRKFPKLSSGTFCKQEFLKHACTTGNGLPFQAPHKHATSRIEEDLVCSYAKYRSKLEEARDALPVNEGEKLTGLRTEELEWFSIFLSVGDWSIGTEGNRHEHANSVQPPRSGSSDIAIENLCNQLGFLGNVKGFSERLAAPFLKGKGGATLWGNRNVLMLSAHVDNWLALLAGEHVGSVVQQELGVEEGFLFRNLKEKDSVSRTEGPKESIRLEKQRHMFQLSAADPEFSLFEQSLSFLGCSMENLRSSMAKWVESNLEEQSGAWAPTLCSSRDGTDDVNCGKFVFHASQDFELHLSEVSSVLCWSQRYLQMRLLWELQNNFHSTLIEHGLAPNQTEAILLCILSFPAIRVIASEIKQSPDPAIAVQGNRNFCCIRINEKPPAFRIEDCKLTLRASHSPQNVHIEVFFTRQLNESGIVVTAQLCGDSFQEGKAFVWEAWRDAFYMSIQSARRAQVEHQIANASPSVRSSIGGIGEGICEIETVNSGIGPTMKVWKGWPPHRETLSKYEMMTDGLILERKKTAVIPSKAHLRHWKRSTFIERPRIQYIPVSYEKATGQYLTRASLVAQDFLRKAAGCSVDENVGESAKGRRELELQRYEILATEADDDIALGKALKILISRNSNFGAIERAVELLEGYFTSEATKAPSVRMLESLPRPVRKENWVQKIQRHYQELMTATRFDPGVVVSFADFCSRVPSFRKEMLNEDGIRALVIVILRNTYSGNILLTLELTKSLELLLETGIREWYYLACSMNFNNIERASKILSRSRNGVILTIPLRFRMFFLSFFGTLETSCTEENIPLLPDSKLELEKRKADAQERLDQLFSKPVEYEVDDYVFRAEELYTQAADESDLVSAHYLACLIDLCMPPDPSSAKKMYTQAVKLYTRAMNGGIDSALCPLALLYFDGRGVTRNPSYAAELYSRAIEKRGDIMAMHNLGLMLQEGAEGVPVDVPRAVQLFSRAVEEGGDVDSMNRLAFLLETGREGVPKDVPYAVRMLELAIKERGDLRAKMNLARLSEIGAVGVPVNLKRAFALYKSAVVEDGETYAMIKLGQLYLKGTYVPANAVRATQLFQLAIDKDGKEDALVHLAGVLVEGAIGVPQDPIRAVELYTRAIEEHGSGDAMFGLASLLEFGKKGVPSDSARAFSLYNRAVSEKKHRGAARRLKKVEKQKEVLEQAKHIWSK